MTDRDLKNALASFDDDFQRVKEAAQEGKARKRNSKKAGGGDALLSAVEKFARGEKEKKQARKRAIRLLKKLDKTTYKVDSSLLEKILATEPGTKRPPYKEMPKKTTVFTEEDFQKFEEEYFVSGSA